MESPRSAAEVRERRKFAQERECVPFVLVAMIVDAV